MWLLVALEDTMVVPDAVVAEEMVGVAEAVVMVAGEDDRLCQEPFTKSWRS